MTTAEAVAEFEAQGTLQPGQEGWWKVWGARAAHVEVGDLIVTLDPDRDTAWALIDGTFLAKASPMRVGLSADGERFTIGALASIVVLRRGTKNTLVP